MKTTTYLFLVALSLVLSTTAHAQEDNQPISIHRLSLELGMQFGNFELLGNEADSRIMSSKRKQNATFGKSFGIGCAFNYRTIKGLDIFYNPHYEYINEKLVEIYSMSMRDIGLRYQVVELGSFYPFVKLSQTNFTIGGLRVFDPTIGPSQTTSREYDWKGKGFTLGAGLDFQMTEKVLLTIFTNKLIPTGELEKNNRKRRLREPSVI